MSMMALFRQVSPGVLGRLKANPELIKAAMSFGGEGAELGINPGLQKMLSQMPAAMQAKLRARLEQGRPPRGPNALAEAGVSTAELPEPLDLGKAWHGVHFLLCGDVGVTDEALSRVVMGGEELGEDLGYGPARVLVPEAVSALASAMEGVSEKELEARFDPKAMARAGVYPSGWGSTDAREREWLLDAFRQVRDYYVEARARGFGMLLYLT